MTWLLILLMCGSGAGIPAAFAQTSRAKKTTAQPAQPHKWPIESLKVEGNHNYTQAQILAVAGLKIGQLAGKQEFEAARDRLVAPAMFETVGYKFAPGGDKNGYAASFQVVEAQPAYPIRFDDLGVPEKELADYLRGKDPLFAPRLAATKPVLERYKQWIQEYVTAHNGKDKVIAKVTPVGVPSGPGEFVILFRPARSDPAVAEVAFEGNQVIPTSALQNAIAEVAVGLPYKEEAFRQCLDSSIRPLYDARGRIRVTFTKVTVENAKDVQGLAVKVTLEEGGTYDLGGVRVEGAPHFEAVRLLKTAKFKNGDLELRGGAIAEDREVQERRSRRLRRSWQGCGPHQKGAGASRLHAERRANRAPYRRCQEDREPGATHRRRPAVPFRNAAHRRVGPQRRGRYPEDVDAQASHAVQPRISGLLSPASTRGGPLRQPGRHPGRDEDRR